MNIKTKIALLFSAIVMLILVIFSVSIFYLYSVFRENDFYTRLHEKAHKTVELLFQTTEVDAKVLQIIDKYDLQTLFEEEIVILDSNQKLIYQTKNNTMAVNKAIIEEVKLKKTVKSSTKNREMIALRIYTNGKFCYVFLSAVDKYGLKKRNKLGIIISLACILAVLILYLAGYYFSNKILEPIKTVIKQVNMINLSNLNIRVKAGAGNDEIAQLTSTFNKMLERLEEAVVMQKNFVSNASHEMRTPLTAIRGNIEVALMQSRSSNDYQTILLGVLEEVSRLTKMTNGLLELARISSMGTKLNQQPFRIDETLWQSKEEVELKNNQYNVKLSFKNFPNEEESLLVLGNESLIKTSFVNLMENACKFSSKNESEVVLEIFNDYFKVIFIDNGIGIKQEDLPYIFQPFYRSATTGLMQSGYGIGLSLVEKIITIHKGKIDVCSYVNSGTIFTIYLGK